VLINKPKGHYYGGLVSAPVFKNILTRIYDLEKGKYDRPRQNTDFKIAGIVNHQTKNEDMNYDLQQNKDPKESQNIFVADSKLNVMPNLRGKTLKEALIILNELGIKWSISGSGVVSEQSIPPGQVMNKRKTCIITCSQISATGTRIY